MIYTLSYIEDEAQKILSSWNGKDNVFYVEGEKYTEGEAQMAHDLIGRLDEIRNLASELRIWKSTQT